jgi:hypothetical protein
MSKYDPLFQHLSQSTGAVQLQFIDVEKILGFPLPSSARRHAAWWSNSGGTHVQSAAWQAAGYKTEDVDLHQETIKFVPEVAGFAEMKQPRIKSDTPPKPEAPSEAKHHPAYGAMKGMITLLPGVDLTEPSYPDWKKLYGEDK